MSIKNKKIAIIGAGMTGVSCLKSLISTGATIDVFEKSRGAGGRMATRRMENGISADHGAQYFTARSDDFRNAVNSWKSAGLIEHWNANNTENCFVGTPAMNSPLKHEMLSANLHTSTRVDRVEKAGEKWTVHTEEYTYSDYDYVVCTVPAPQVPDIIEKAAPTLVKTVNAVTIAPCWALLVVFDKPLNSEVNNWRESNNVISWIARNSSKQGRDFSQDSWTIHATPEWSAENLELNPDDAAHILYGTFTKIINESGQEPSTKMAHRWRYAKTLKPLGKPFLTNEDQTLYIGGDWCLGARVENAFESGKLIAESLKKLSA